MRTSVRRASAPAMGLLCVLVLASACSGGTQQSAEGGGTGTRGAQTKGPGESGTAGLLPKPELDSIQFGISANDPHQFALQLAADQGLFKKYGITDVGGHFFNSSSSTQKALISGQVDVVTNNATRTVLSRATDRPCVDVAVMINKLPDVLYGGKGIENAADLRGKKVAHHGPGGQSYTEAVVGVRALGLSVDDVQLTTVGGQTARVAALKAGTVAAAPADPALAGKLAKVGIKPLVNLAKSDVHFPGSNIEFRQEFVKKYPKTVLAVTAAVLEAVQEEFTNTSDVAKRYAGWAQVDPPESNDIWQNYINSPLPSRDLRSSLEAYKNAQDVMANINPEVGKVNVSKAYDDTFLNKLKKIGFNKKVSVPSS